MSQTRRYINPFAAISAGNMSGNITGTVISLRDVDNVSAVYYWTGTAPVGEVKVYVQNGSSTFSLLGISPVAAVSGASGDNNILITDVSFEKIRFDYVRTSGTGTLNVIITGKGR
jgi:hypothetical protein